MSYLSDAFFGLSPWSPPAPTPWSVFGVPAGGAPVQPTDDDQAPPIMGSREEAGGPDMIARYPDGTPILDRNDNPMRKPPFADLGLAVQRGQAISDRWLPQRLLTLYGWLRQGGDMDYHRLAGHETDPVRAYRDVSNYLVGAVPAAANVPKWISDLAGSIYALATSDAPSGRDQKMWDLGRSDYLNNRLSFPGVQPAGPPMIYPPPLNQDPDRAVPFPGLQPLGSPTIYPSRSVDLWSFPGSP